MRRHRGDESSALITSDAAVPTNHQGSGGRIGPFDVRWQQLNAHRWALPASIIGGMAALGLAVFGIPPVDLHGPFHRFGFMDPLCGMTRGVTALARGDLRTAWSYNPASPLLVGGAIGVVVRSFIGRLTGRWLNFTLRWTRTTLIIAIALLAAWWISQQLHADLLS